MDAREVALAEIVDIAQRHDLVAKDITAALKTATKDSLGGKILTRLLAYIGGIFILCGLGFLIEMHWENMNTAAHLVITLGTGLVALLLAILFLDHDKFAKAAIPLFLVAALFESYGIMIAFDELGTGGDPQHAVLAMTTVMTLQMLAVFSRYQRAVLLFIALAFGVTMFSIAFDLLGVDYEWNSLIIGVSCLLITYGIDQTVHRTIAPFWYFTGSVIFLWAAFDLIEDTPVHILYLGLAAFMIYLSTVVKSRTLLFVSTCSMIGYLGYFTEEYFVDSIGWPVGLILMGLILIGLSSLAIGINKKYIAESE